MSGGEGGLQGNKLNDRGKTPHYPTSLQNSAAALGVRCIRRA